MICGKACPGKLKCHLGQLSWQLPDLEKPGYLDHEAQNPKLCAKIFDIVT